MKRTPQDTRKLPNQMPSNTVRVKTPGENDVLCGRGGATNNHIGNKRFRQVVAVHQPEYLVAKKRDKSGIARMIVKMVRDRGGKFLKKVEPSLDDGGGDGGDDDDNVGYWVDIGDRKASEKTSQALREGLDVRERTGVVGTGEDNALFPDTRGKKRKSGEGAKESKKRQRVEGSVTSPLPRTPSAVIDSIVGTVKPTGVPSASNLALLPPPSSQPVKLEEEGGSVSGGNSGGNSGGSGSRGTNVGSAVTYVCNPPDQPPARNTSSDCSDVVAV